MARTPRILRIMPACRPVLMVSSARTSKASRSCDAPRSRLSQCAPPAAGRMARLDGVPSPDRTPRAQVILLLTRALQPRSAGAGHLLRAIPGTPATLDPGEAQVDMSGSTLSRQRAHRILRAALLDRVQPLGAFCDSSDAAALCTPARFVLRRATGTPQLFSIAEASKSD